jgi:hypothetical protein
VVLHDGNIAHVGGFLICRTRESDVWVGQIVEILADTRAGVLLGILVQEYNIGEHVAPYHFPRLHKSAKPSVLCKLKVCTTVMSVGVSLT